MKLAMLTGGALALSLIGAAGASAEMAYVAGPYGWSPYYVDTPLVPRAVVPAPAYVTRPAYRVVTAPRFVVQRREPIYIVEQAPPWVTERRAYVGPTIYTARSLPVEYVVPGGPCTIDITGVQFCH